MTRIFAVLASANLFALILTSASGLILQLHPSTTGGETPQLAHFSLGLGASILTLLVHCIIFTYFLGTGRWVKEVKYAYGLPDEPLPRLTRELKRKSFPIALAAMLVTIAAAAAGAGEKLHEWPRYVHIVLSVAAVVVNAAASVIEYRHVRTNTWIIEQVMVEVERRRGELGLVSNTDALRQEQLGN
jgi:hypothetical protein